MEIKSFREYVNEAGYMDKDIYTNSVITGANILAGQFDDKAYDLLVKYMLDNGYIDEDDYNEYEDGEKDGESIVNQGYYYNLITDKKSILNMIQFFRSKRIIDSRGIITKKYGKEKDYWDGVESELRGMAKY